MENFMIDQEGAIRLADFGLSGPMDDPCPKVAGTPWTMSPAGFLGIDDGAQGDWCVGGTCGMEVRACSLLKGDGDALDHVSRRVLGDRRRCSG